jgi:hypothetical protein
MISPFELPRFKEVMEVWERLAVFSSIGRALLLAMAVLDAWVGVFPSKIGGSIIDQATCQHLLGLYFLEEALELALLFVQQSFADRLALSEPMSINLLPRDRMTSFRPLRVFRLSERMEDGEGGSGSALLKRQTPGI